MAKTSETLARRMVRRAIEAEAGGCLAKAAKHVAAAAEKAATGLPDRDTDRAGHDSCVCAMHAHVKAGEQYLAQHALLTGDMDERPTPEPAHASLSKALDCIGAAHKAMAALPNPQAEAEHTACVRSVHRHVRQADGCLDKYRSAAADDNNLAVRRRLMPRRGGPRAGSGDRGGARANPALRGAIGFLRQGRQQRPDHWPVSLNNSQRRRAILGSVPRPAISARN
jgi:hypothetical protein